MTTVFRRIAAQARSVRQRTKAIVSIRLRTFARRTFHDPEPVLRRLRDVEIQLARTDTPDLVRRLRTGRLKSDREARDALLSAHGMAGVVGAKVYVAPGEA